MTDILERHKEAKERAAQLRDEVTRTRRMRTDANVQTVAKQLGYRSLKEQRRAFSCVRTLKGHTGKVYALGWSSHDSNKVVSASQDGRLIVWNAFTGVKTHAIKLVCAWVMTCAFSPDGRSVAAGGLDNVCSIFDLERRMERDGNVQASRMLAGHKGYISCCRYVDESQVLTSSGDQTCILWDVNSNARLQTFGGDTATAHQSDVMSVAVSPADRCVFVSGSCDSTAKLWDTRTPERALKTFQGHTMDVNAVQFLPDGKTFGTGSDDGSCRIFDIRSGHELMKYQVPTSASVTSIAFSFSGRMLFAGYSDRVSYVWDVATGEVHSQLEEHQGRVSCLAMAPDGMALCTGSWDQTLRVFAVPF